MNTIKEKGSLFLTIILVVMVAAIGIYNYLNNSKFFATSITSLLTLLIALVFSYWFVQLKNDKKNKNAKIDKLIYKIQDIVCQSDFISSNSEEISRKNLIKHRSVANKIIYLKEVCKGKGEIEKAVIELENEFGRLREFYGDHYRDQDYMCKSEKELFNFITKIDDKADEIHIMLL